MMRDFHTVASDEHSWYFHDEEPEAQQDKTAAPTMISCDVHGVPTKISWNIRTHSSSSYPSANTSPVLFGGNKAHPYARDSSWTDTTTEYIDDEDDDDEDDDSGSYGTLDYSVDTLGEERRSTRMMQHHYLQQALYIHSSRSDSPAALLAAIHPPPPQALPLSDYPQEELLLQQMYRDELERLDVHGPPQSSQKEDHHDTSCFGFRLFGRRLRDCLSQNNSASRSSG